MTKVCRISALSLVLLICASCGSTSNPIVHAAPSPAFIPSHQEGICPTGCAAFQSSNFLELRFGPTTNTDQDGFTFTLPAPIHVKLLDVWIGTQSGQIFESDSRLQIVFPDSSYMEFKAQYDKHADIVGDLQRTFPVDLMLPAGTQLSVYHSAQGVIQCPSSGCGFDTTWSLTAF